jgi:cell division protein ZapA
MPLVNVLLNGRAYTLACDEGEEDHLRELGEFLDKRIRELTSTVGQVGDSRLLVMAGLVVADELNDAFARIEERDSEIAALKARLEEPAEAIGQAEDRVAEILESAAARIEAIAAKVSHT